MPYGQTASSSTLQALVFLWKSGLSEFFLLLKYCVRYPQGQALGALLELMHLFFSNSKFTD